MENQSWMVGAKVTIIILLSSFIPILTASDEEILFTWKDENGRKVISSELPMEIDDFEIIRAGKGITTMDSVKPRTKPYKNQNSNSNHLIKKSTKKKKNSSLCSNLRKSLKNVNAQLRKGYSNPKTGEFWRKKRKNLNARIREKCD